MKITYKIEIATGPTVTHALAALEVQVNARMAEGFDSLGRVQVGAANGGAVAFKELSRYEYDEEPEDVGFSEKPAPKPVKPKSKVV
jgi:hypothetical protein